MSQGLATTNTAAVRTPGLRDQVQAVKDLVAKDCTDAELDLFCRVCERTGLDPFARQIYAIKRAGKLGIQTSIDGFRLTAQRTGKYRGQLGPFWCGEDGAWKDVWLAAKPPAAARIGVLHADFAEPVWSVARFVDYNAGGPMWQKMGPTMIAKCAEALGLRRCFPQELSSLYTAEEMDQAGPADGYTPPAKSVGSLARPKAAPRGVGGEHMPQPVTDVEAKLEASVMTDVINPKTGEVIARAPKVTKAQLAKIHILKANCRFADDDWKGRLSAKYGRESSAELSKEQAGDLIERLEKMWARVGDAVNEIAPHLEERGDEPMPEEMEST